MCLCRMCELLWGVTMRALPARTATGTSLAGVGAALACVGALRGGAETALGDAGTALGDAGTALVGAAPAPAPASNATADAGHGHESRVGIESLMARETARMRESLARATLGSDHGLLLARKRSTDWAFLAAAVTAGVGAGVNDPAELLASVACCDPGGQASCAASADSDAPRKPWLAPSAAKAQVVADAVTYFAEPSGSDFPCAIGWRVVVDGEGVVARALWHEPMMALRGFDAPLVPDRTVVRLSVRGTEVECWGFGTISDPWPSSPAPLDQPSDAYDLADAARHWWWSRAITDSEPVPSIVHARSARTTSAAVPLGILLPECEMERVSAWKVDSWHATGTSRTVTAHEDARRTAGSTRASMSVTFRSDASWLRAYPSHDRRGRLAALKVNWIDGGSVRAALAWTSLAEREAISRASLGTPSHAWLDAQSRLQLLQHLPRAAVLPEPYARSLVVGETADASASHARATANVWHAALDGDCAALAQALADAERLRRFRGVPRSTDAMALVALAESLLSHGAPERSIALVVARHHAIAQSLPVDCAAAAAEQSDHDIAPSIALGEYRRMLMQQGRPWAAAQCGADTHGSNADDRTIPVVTSVTDPLVIRLNDWLMRTGPSAPVPA